MGEKNPCISKSTWEFLSFQRVNFKNIDRNNESKYFNAMYLYYSCWPNEAQNVNLQKLNLRIEHIAGLNANSFKNYSEPYMCGNYGK